MRFCNQGTEFWDVRHVGFNGCKWLRVSLFIVNLLTVNELRMFRSVTCPDLSAGGCFAKTMTSLVNYTIRVSCSSFFCFFLFNIISPKTERFKY